MHPCWAGWRCSSRRTQCRIAPHAASLPLIAAAQTQRTVQPLVAQLLCGRDLSAQACEGLHACRDAQLARQRGQQDQERTEPGVEAVVDVAPLAGRLVLFLSGAVEHAVLPTMGAERVAITAWMQ